MILGQDLIISINTDQNNLIPVCHSKTCSLSRDRDMLTITNPTTADESYIPSTKRGTISGDGLMIYQDVINGVSVLEWLESGALVAFKFSTSLSGGLIYSGSMYIDHWEISGEISDMVTYSFTAKINGALKIEKNDFVKTVYLSDLFGVRLAGCPNPYPVAVLWYDGSLIGLANNPDDVVSQFNGYAPNLYYRLSSPDNSCNYTMNIVWNAPEQPNWVPAEAGGLTGLWTGSGDGGISPSENGQDLITPIEVEP
ncbi:phage tail tube protein [Chitinophaga sp.]|uniref:phage tail tube protein n=1 Tax=Chitinophaga sp. TaxID=1869181 RepID=UPI0031DCA581